MVLKPIRYASVLFTLLLCSHSWSQQQNFNKGINWQSFRGEDAKGIADNFPTPASWDVKDSKTIKWKTEIPGLGHSSPVIWKDRIFITTAISGKDIPELKVGDMASFSASGVAADGKLYFTSEQGDIFVVRAGPDFKVLSKIFLKPGMEKAVKI